MPFASRPERSDLNLNPVAREEKQGVRRAGDPGLDPPRQVRRRRRDRRCSKNTGAGPLLTHRLLRAGRGRHPLPRPRLGRLSLYSAVVRVLLAPRGVSF